MSSIQKRDNYTLYWEFHLGYQVAYNLYLHLLLKGWDFYTLASAAGITPYVLGKTLNNLKDLPNRVLYTPSYKNITKINYNLLNFYPPTKHRERLPFDGLQTGTRQNKKPTTKKETYYV